MPSRGSGGTETRGVPFGEALRFWTRLGFINFGGPAGQISIMHTELVERRRWIPEAEFLRALNFTMVLPGPEAQQLATYVGWRMHGLRGAVAAGSLFVLPSVVVLLVLAWLTVAHADVPLVAGLLWGVQPVVVAIVVDAVLRLGRRTLTRPVLVLFAVGAFLALRLGVVFPVVVLAAGLLGLALAGVLPRATHVHGQATAATEEASPLPPAPAPSAARAARIVAVFAALWAVPVGAVVLWRGLGDVLTGQALFFTKAAFVTFGGAYAVLSYVADVAVLREGWLTAEQMVQGLALAESTPGPLIMVVQYVAFLGSWNAAGAGDPLLTATLGALLVTWVTFLPSFAFILVGGPYVEALAGNAKVQAALAGVTAAVVGVIADLGVFFGERVLAPAGALDAVAVLAALLAFGALRSLRAPVPPLVLLGGLAGAVLAAAGFR